MACVARSKFAVDGPLGWFRGKFMAPILFLLLVVAVVLAWFASEFQDRRWLRLLLGCCALVLVGSGAYLTATIGERFNSNAW